MDVRLPHLDPLTVRGVALSDESRQFALASFVHEQLRLRHGELTGFERKGIQDVADGCDVEQNSAVGGF
jgi:hypothetical protein